ncbi:MAG TPA: hypothetical protein VFU43_23995 [Streptosporangiaceae bacterium]|nr:hypothetical protein [Streptosporangiaceae bacterium]
MGVRAGLEYPEGDPGGLMSAASRLSSLAALVAAEAGGIARAGQVAGWEGRRYALFQAAVRGIAPGLESGAGALRRAARLVDDLAEQLQRAQRQIRAWAEEIEAAEKDVEAAESALANERFKRQTFGDPLAPFPGPDPVQEAQASYDKAARHLAELRGRYQPRARRLCEELEQEDRSVSAALLAAAAAAPAGGSSAPGAPNVPADVRLFAPTFIFTPSESYLPADPRRNAIDFRQVDSAADLERYLRGQGAGAPIFYRVRDFGDEKVIEYWFYRRNDDFRDLGVHTHLNDVEGVAVRLRDGRPVEVGYSRHSGGCSLPYGDAPKRGGHPVSYPSDGSAANSPYPGVADNEAKLFGVDVNPLGELHGPAPGERTPPANVVRGEDNLVRHGANAERSWQLLGGNGNGGQLADDEDNRPLNSSNQGKFVPGSSVWANECEELPSRE